MSFRSLLPEIALAQSLLRGMDIETETTALDALAVPAWKRVIDRAARAAMADGRSFEEARRDSGTTMHSAALVLAISVAVWIGSDEFGNPGNLIVACVAGVLAWGLGTVVCCWVSRLVVAGADRVGTDEVARVLAFAMAPQLLAVFNGLPIIGPLNRLLLFFWQIGVLVVAVRTTFHVNVGRALVVLALTLLALVGGVWLLVAMLNAV